MVERNFTKPMYPRDATLPFLDSKPEWMGLGKRIAECEPDYEMSEEASKKDEDKEQYSFPGILC
jgi:hypothetical protein